MLACGAMQDAVVTLRVKATCRIDSVRFSPDGRFVAWVECGHAAYELVCCEAATAREAFRRRTGFHWNALAWAGPTTLAAWAARPGARDADDAPWTVEFIAAPEGNVLARHTLPAEVSRQDSPHLRGAHNAARVLVATTRSHHRGASRPGKPGQGWIVDAATGSAVRHLDAASVLAPEADGPLSLWALAPDGERVAVASFVGVDRDDDTLHCFAPEGVSRMATGRLHQPTWIDARTVLARGDVAGEQTICVACAGEAAPRFRARSAGLFAFDAVPAGPAVALYDATTRTFTLRTVAGDERTLGARAPFDAEWATPYFSFLAVQRDGATRVLLGSADKVPPAKRASVPGVEGDAAPPQRGIALSDALTGDTVLVHGVDAIHDHDLGGLFNPVEFHADPSGRSLAIVVRRATSKKQHAPQHHHLIVCDLDAALGALAPRKPAKRPRAPGA